MKEIDVRDIIKDTNVEKVLAVLLAKKFNIESEAAELYISQKIDSKINEIGQKISSGDMSPQEFNKARRLSDVNLMELSDRIIKDE
jgi:recombinational DNA repair protein RecR